MTEILPDQITQKAREFLHDNASIPVISGAGYPEGGGCYTLATGVVYELSLVECRQIGMPKWPWDFAKHSKEPWRVLPEIREGRDHSYINGYDIYNEEGEIVGCEGLTGGAVEAANAARAVACVNGCAGVANPSFIGEAIRILEDINRLSYTTLRDRIEKVLIGLSQPVVGGSNEVD